MTEKHLTDQKFTDFNLEKSLISGITDSGFEFCTPIQAESLPVLLEGTDVAGQAQTGTGKTVAFLLACFNHLLNHPPPEKKPQTQIRTLILAPTRELAIQIYKDAEVLSKHTDLKLGLIYGGTGYDEQKEVLAKGVDILIGTPGRLIDFYKQNLYGLKFAQAVILDEADRMFDLGFIKDIRYLLRQMPAPEERLNMLFSATLSFRVMELAYEHMNNPVEIKIDADVRVATKIEEYSFYPADEEKPGLLVNLLKRDDPERVLVFVNTRHGVEAVSVSLSANDISNAALSGDVPQRKRENLLQGFKDGKYKILVATDVAARGLHIPAVSHVYNYDLPQDADDYVHRIGRTARAGKSGVAISFLCEKYAYSVLDIESYIGHSIPKKPIESWMTEAIETGKPIRSKKRAPSKKPKTSRPAKSTPIKAAANTIVKDVTTETSSQADKELVPEVVSEVVSEVMPELSTEPDTKIDPDKIPEPNLEEKKPAPKVSNIENKKINAPVPLPKNRFSRKFGEVPMVG